jgi:hypothetical protein
VSTESRDTDWLQLRHSLQHSEGALHTLDGLDRHDGVSYCVLVKQHSISQGDTNE